MAGEELRLLLDAPLRGRLSNRSRPFSFDAERAVELWKSKQFTSITDLAKHLGASRGQVSRLLHLRGAIEREQGEELFAGRNRCRVEGQSAISRS